MELKYLVVFLALGLLYLLYNKWPATGLRNTFAGWRAPALPNLPQNSATWFRWILVGLVGLVLLGLTLPLLLGIIAFLVSPGTTELHPLLWIVGLLLVVGLAFYFLSWIAGGTLLGLVILALLLPVLALLPWAEIGRWFVDSITDTLSSANSYLTSKSGSVPALPWAKIILAAILIAAGLVFMPFKEGWKRVVATIAVILIAIPAASYFVDLYNSPSRSAPFQTARTIDTRTVQCPGGTERFTLTKGLLTKISSDDCQVRLFLEGDDCVEAYSSRRSYIGRACAKGQFEIRGIAHYLSAAQGEVEARVTRCPTGSPITNMGSCT